MPTETAGNRAVKIILTGCTGTGKTTLGLHMQEKGYVQRYIHEDWKWPELRGESVEAKSKTLEASVHWLNKRAELIQHDNSSFVMDRGPMDVLQQWAVLQYASPQAWSELEERSRLLLKMVNLIVFFPWQSRSRIAPPEKANPDGLLRNMGGYNDIRIQSLLLGVIHQLVPSPKILVLPRQTTSTKDRSALIMKRIQKLQSLATPSRKSCDKIPHEEIG